MGSSRELVRKGHTQDRTQRAFCSPLAVRVVLPPDCVPPGWGEVSRPRLSGRPVVRQPANPQDCG
jgi:hypothetical protein